MRLAALAGPGLAGHGKLLREPLTSSIDLLPTLCDLAGLKAPGSLPGRSMAGWLRGESKPANNEYVGSGLEGRATLWREMTGLPFRDSQCGFKLMDRTRVIPLFEKMVVDRFAFDVELLFLCSRFGLRVAEIPIVWRNDPRTTVSPLTDAPRMLFDIARVRWRFRRGLYNPAVAAAARG